MNHYYRLVRSADGTRYMPAPETAKSQGKASKAVASVSVLLGLVAAGGNAWAQAPPANALPTGAQVAAGQASIGQNGNQMTIDQGSDRAVINWQGFDIGSQAAVRFNQPGTSSVALNRVVAGDASQIHGQLSANGQLWVLNPNGVVFGAGSRVDVGGLVASTMHSSDADFMAGKAVFHRNGSTGSVLNQGEITAHGDGGQGGLVALLAPTVKNEGIIRAQLGSVVLAAGDRITLSTGVGGRLQVAPDPATVKTLIENKQLIVADGGQVLMTSRAADALSAGVVSNSGAVQARTLAHQEGRIVLLADMQHGSTQVAGLLDASAPDGGNGGFVDTSAARVQIQAGTRVTTQAASGKTGQWLIDPTDFTISAGAATQTDSGIGADTLVANLASTDVTLQTVAAGSDKGSIHVNADVRYDANQLTLNAHHDININATMDVGGTGRLALNHGNTLGNAATAPAADSQLSINGRVNFAQAGAGLLSINGHGYTVINDVAALQDMGSNLGGKYALGADIDASATAGWNLNAGIYNGFAPIGSSSDNTDATRFTGSFDGLGHSIRDLTVNVTQPQYPGNPGFSSSYAGLFGATGSAARIAHVGLDNASIKASGGIWNSAGALVGWNNGAIVQSYATGNATAEGGIGTYAGALVGENYGSISQSYATGSATAKDGNANFAGALAGENYGSISQSYWSADRNPGQPGVGNNSGLDAESQGLTDAEFQKASSFAAWGSDIDDQGGTGAAWRIYEGHSTPLLRTFLKQVTVDLGALASKTYDGTTGSGVIGGSDYSIAPGVVLGGAGSDLSYQSNNKNAGNYSAKNGGLLVSGLYSNQQGYDISYQGSFEITQASLTVTADAASKVYGDADDLRYTSSGLVHGDSLGGSLGRAAGENVGSYAINQGTLANSNYSISFNGNQLQITPKALTVTADAASKVYGDGDADDLKYTSSGLVHGDSLGGSLGRAAGENVGSYAINQGTLANSNYSISFNGNQLQITPKALTVTADAASKVYGDVDDLKYTSSGLIHGDRLGGSLGRAAGENVGSYAITQGSLAHSNYSISFTGNQLQITPKALTVTADAASKVYGDADDLMYTSSGLIHGDRLGGSLGRASGENVGSYAINKGTLANSNYRITFNGNQLQITPRALTITAGNAQKTAGQSLVFQGHEFTAQGLVGAEQIQSVQLDSTGAAASAAAGSYAIVASHLRAGAGFDARNYDIRYVDGQLQVQAQAQRTALGVGVGDLWRLYSPQLMQQPGPQVPPAQKKPLLTIEPEHIRMAAI